jgi:hypothetical protein
VTPHERHAGMDTALLCKRVDVYEAAKAAHPQRWSGPTRNLQPVRVVHLNPHQQVEEKKIVKRKKIQNSKKPLKFNLLGDN